jgi:formate dehydrogenase maturation protein FdhE
VDLSSKCFPPTMKVVTALHIAWLKCHILLPHSAMADSVCCGACGSHNHQ